jgi:transcriptional regulator with XRE-family HTH domain
MLLAIKLVESGRAREIRKRARWSQQRLGEYVGVSHAMIVHWERGTIVPRSDFAVRYGRKLRELRADSERSG